MGRLSDGSFVQSLAYVLFCRSLFLFRCLGLQVTCLFAIQNSPYSSNIVSFAQLMSSNFSKDIDLNQNIFLIFKNQDQPIFNNRILLSLKENLQHILKTQKLKFTPQPCLRLHLLYFTFRQSNILSTTFLTNGPVSNMNGVTTIYAFGMRENQLTKKSSVKKPCFIPVPKNVIPNGNS